MTPAATPRLDAVVAWLNSDRTAPLAPCPRHLVDWADLTPTQRRAVEVAAWASGAPAELPEPPKGPTP
jgi:hypothetical protein